jgi:PAS domain S-box-containing protein
MELGRSEERFHLLVDAVRDYAIFMLDPRGYVTSWNAGAERLKGYTEREIVGQHFSRFYPPEDVAAGKPQRVLAEAVRAGRFEDVGWRVRKDGSRFWADVTVTAIEDEAGQLLGFAKVTRDLTERLRAEEDRRQRQAAEEVARLRGEFLSVAAHELKTPLTSLRGMAQLTLRRYAREGDVAPERVVRALGQIVDQAGKLGRLVDQLLDVTRLEAGHLALDRRETDMGALTASIVEAFRTRSAGDRIRLDLPNNPVSAFADPLRIEQVVINLIDNALKFSPEGAPVWVSVTEIGPGHDGNAGGPAAGPAGRSDGGPAASRSDDLATGDGRADGPATGAGRVRITVTDRGPGVAPEERPHLFDRFFRSPATAYTSGMGIGLYVSRQIVELHGGTVRAEFPPEGGTRFVVDLDAERDGAADEGHDAS